MPYRIIKSNIKKNFSNQELKETYNAKNNVLNGYYQHTELTPSQFFEEVFSEALDNDLMVGDNEYGTGKANGKIVMYSPSLSKKLHYKEKDLKYITKNKKLVLTKDNIYDLNIEGYNGVLASVNLHYGYTGQKGLAYYCNFDIDLDEIYTEQDLRKLIKCFENGKILSPTIITSSGTGMHLIYRLKTPIRVFKDTYSQLYLKAIKSALCKTIEIAYGFDSKYKGRIKPLALDQMTRCVGSTTKIGEGASNLEEAKNNACKAWLIGNSYSLEEIFNYVKDNIDAGFYVSVEKEFCVSGYYNYVIAQDCKKDMINDIKNKKFDKVDEPRKTVKGSKDKKYYVVSENLYYSWLKRCKEEVKEGSRYFAMLGLASYGIKCNIPKIEVLEDLQKLQKHYNKISKEKITNEDVESALKGFSLDGKYSKGETIARRCGLKVKHLKRNYKTQEEHLNNIRKNAGRKSKKAELSSFLSMQLKNGIDVSKMSVREIALKSNISKSTVAKYLKGLLFILVKKFKEMKTKYSLKKLCKCKVFKTYNNSLLVAKTPPDFFIT